MSARGKFIGIVLSATLGSFVGTQAFAADITFFAILKGGNEVSNTGQANAGDSNGYGSASLLFRTNSLMCYSILLWNITTPTAAHIHSGPAGVNGGVVVSLTPPGGGAPGHVSECIEIDPAIGAGIRSNPAAFYVNVHTGRFPGGAVRGQVF